MLGSEVLTCPLPSERPPCLDALHNSNPVDSIRTGGTQRDPGQKVQRNADCSCQSQQGKRTIYQTVHHCTNAQMLHHHGEAKWDDGAEEVG